MKAKNRWFFSVVVLTCMAVAGMYHQTSSTSVNAIRFVPTTHKVVALTIDDGPHPAVTPQLQKLFREKQVKVTFFILGKNAAEHPDLVRQAAQDGHEIGSHAYTHKVLNTLTPTEYQKEMDQANALIRELAGEPQVFRPPGGGWNDAIALAALLRGQTTILWSVDAGDWRCPPTSQVVKTVLDNVKPGSIILMHDGQESLPTPEAASIIIDKLREKGYQFVTVSELLQYYEVRH